MLLICIFLLFVPKGTLNLNPFVAMQAPLSRELLEIEELKKEVEFLKQEVSRLNSELNLYHEKTQVWPDAQTSQEDNEAIMEAFFDSSPGILNLFDPELRFLKSDRFTPTYFGLDRHSIVGKSVMELNPTVAENWLGPIMKHVVETGQPEMNVLVEGPVPSRQGETGYWSASYFPVPLPGGKTGIGSIAMEITEKIRTEKILTHERELFQGIFDNIPVMITIYDPDLQNFRFNKVFKQILGWTEDDAALGDFLSKVYPDDTYRQMVIEYMTSLQGGWKEFVMTTKEGTTIDSSWANILLSSGVQIGIGIDIRERKRAEETLRENEQRLQAIFDNAAIGIVEVDQNDRLIGVNRQICQILEYHPNDLLGKTISDITAPEHSALSNDINARLHKGEFNIFEYEKKYLKSNGSPIWVHVTVSAIRDHHSRHLRSIGTIENISERKRTENALRESEEWLRMVIDAADIGTWDFDIETGIAKHSLRHDQIFGYKEAQPEWSYEISVKHIFPEYHLIVREAVANAIKTGILEYDAKILWPDGSIHWIAPRGRVIYNAEGKPLRMAGIVSDITERKIAEEAVKESEEKFRSLFENITEGIAIHELVYENNTPVNYRIIDVNPAFKLFCGIEPETAVGKLSTKVYGTKKPPYLKEYANVAQTRQPHRFETFFPGLNKHFIINAISPKEGQFATVFEDITEQKEIEKEMKRRNEELTRFIYTVSHDLKSPLVTIKSFTSYLKEDIENQDKESQEKDIRYIENAADKMGKLLDELLELSRIGRKDEPKTEVLLEYITHSAVDLVAGRINERKVTVKFTGPKVMVYGHSQRLIQLYQNLIDNAVKFMGNQPNPVIEIGSQPGNNEGKGLILFVRDNGSGIDPRYNHKLFGLFEKLDVNSEGTGIGLALVKRIIEVHNGTIWFISEGLGKGTTFYFTLEGSRALNE